MNEYPHEITIESFSKVDDGGGGYTEDWAVFATVEAFVSPLSGSEYYQAQQTQNPVDYDVYLPYREDIKPSMRVKFKGNTMQIKAMLPSMVDINGEYEKLCLKCSSA